MMIVTLQSYIDDIISLSIDLSGGDVDFPPTIQEELREIHLREQQELLDRLEDLNTEKDNSQQVGR